MKISINDLKSIIKEEIKSVSPSSVSHFDHQSAKKVVSSASNLLKAIEDFESSDSTDEMKTAISSHVDGMKKNLHDMIQNPMSYVTRISKKKVVSFKKTT